MKISGELTCQSWLHLTQFFNLTIVHWATDAKTLEISIFILFLPIMTTEEPTHRVQSGLGFKIFHAVDMRLRASLQSFSRNLGHFTATYYNLASIHSFPGYCHTAYFSFIGNFDTTYYNLAGTNAFIHFFPRLCAMFWFGCYVLGRILSFSCFRFWSSCSSLFRPSSVVFFVSFSSSNLGIGCESRPEVAIWAAKPHTASIHSFGCSQEMHKKLPRNWMRKAHLKVPQPCLSYYKKSFNRHNHFTKQNWCQELPSVEIHTVFFSCSVFIILAGMNVSFVCFKQW